MPYAQRLTKKARGIKHLLPTTMEVMLRDFVYLSLLKSPKSWHFISENVPLSNLQGEKLNDSQREYAWQGEADDLIWICAVIN